MERKNSNSTKKKRTRLNFFVFLIFLGLTCYLIFKDREIENIWAIIEHVDRRFILLSVAMIFIYLLTESAYLKIILKSFQEKSGYFSCFIYSCIEFYFSAITPSSTGGQPAQIYYMAKDGIPIAKSTMALLLNTVVLEIGPDRFGCPSGSF